MHFIYIDVTKYYTQIDWDCDNNDGYERTFINKEQASSKTYYKANFALKRKNYA